jgi:hypothetical protein
MAERVIKAKVGRWTIEEKCETNRGGTQDWQRRAIALGRDGAQEVKVFNKARIIYWWNFKYGRIV